jgi:5-methylthioribose kinase
MSRATDRQQISELAAALRDLKLLGEQQKYVASPLSGGVSCDVFLFEIEESEPVVVKRALASLRVEADWRAPVERAETEVEWLALARQLDPRIAPPVIARDPRRHLFVMPYLPKGGFPVWKHELAAGQVDLGFAEHVGLWLARLHGATAGVDEIWERFSNMAQFRALRLEPYLAYAAEKNPEVSAPLRSLIDGIARSCIALMQGDVSPKNLLHGPETPVFLDAETACYGDPAFDLAFCLNHLLLKSVWHPEHTDAYGRAFAALKDGYCSVISWEPPESLERRAASIVAGLLLARVDGKSPVEYVTRIDEKNFVRRQARRYLQERPGTLEALAKDWTAAIKAYFASSGSR